MEKLTPVLVVEAAFYTFSLCVLEREKHGCAKKPSYQLGHEKFYLTGVGLVLFEYAS